MASVYRVLDATLDVVTGWYRVTVEVNKDAQGATVFSVSAPRTTGATIDPNMIAQAAALWLSSGGNLAQLKNQTWTVN